MESFVTVYQSWDQFKICNKMRKLLNVKHFQMSSILFTIVMLFCLFQWHIARSCNAIKDKHIRDCFYCNRLCNDSCKIEKMGNSVCEVTKAHTCINVASLANLLCCGNNWGKKKSKGNCIFRRVFTSISYNNIFIHITIFLIL